MMKVNLIVPGLLLSLLVDCKPMVDNNSQESNGIESQDREDDPENGGFYQGDILLNNEQKDLIFNTSGKVDTEMRTGLLDERYRWPMMADGYINVPMEISDNFDYNERVLITNAIVGLHKDTCIRFVWKDSRHEDYIYIDDGEGCSSYLGRQGGKQIVTLQKDGCLSRATVQHEIIHALGYTHMHNHQDRDQYVNINWQNIKNKQTYNFKKVSAWQYDNFGTPYDFSSVMHYSSKAFTKNGEDTITPKFSIYKKSFGKAEERSAGDVIRLNQMYDCKKT